MENSADPDKMPHFTATHLGLAPYLDWSYSRNCFINQFRQMFVYDEIHVPKASWVMEKFFATHKDILSSSGSSLFANALHWILRLIWLLYFYTIEIYS